LAVTPAGIDRGTEQADQHDDHDLFSDLMLRLAVAAGDINMSNARVFKLVFEKVPIDNENRT
jgi:hypothetical protein